MYELIKKDIGGMNKLLLVLALSFAPLVVKGERPVPSVAEPVRRNTIVVSAGLALERLSHSRLGPYLSAEYARNLQGKFWVGGRLSVEKSTLAGCFPAEGYLTDYVLTTAYGLAYWEFPVARRWLSFRVGGGVGVGLHSALGYSYHAVSPYLLARAEWVVHITRNFGITLAPLIAGPGAISRFEWSPWAPANIYGGTEMLGKSDWWGHIGFYGKF